MSDGRGTARRVMPAWCAVACLLAAWMLAPARVLTHGTLTTTVLFDREIVRILNAHCVTCHSDGGPSFPLSTYDQTWRRSQAIRTTVLRRHMPPWPAVAGYGRFANDNSLTLRETQFLVSWVEGLGPRNSGTVFLNVPDVKSAPREEVRAMAHTNHWQVGQPDLVRPLEPARVEAGQSQRTIRSVLDVGSPVELRLRAIEFQPGDRRVVRAATFTVEGTGQWLGSWTPWYGYASVPDGAMYRLPPRARIVAEIQYAGVEAPVTDRGTLGLFLADASATKPVTDLVLHAGKPTRIARDTTVWALKPDIVAGMTSIEVRARRPDGGVEILLFAKDVSLDWPTPFVLKQPTLLRRGTQLSFIAHRGASSSIPPLLDGLRLTVARY